MIGIAPKGIQAADIDALAGSNASDREIANIKSEKINATRTRAMVSSRVSPVVSITHLPQEEGRVWQAILAAQGIPTEYATDWERDPFGLMRQLEECVARQQPIPGLLLVGMDVKAPGSDVLMAGEICIWCRRHCPDLKVVLVHPRQDTVGELQRRWALRRGAADVLPKLSRANLLTSAVRLMSVLGGGLNPEPLRHIADLLPQPVEPPPGPPAPADVKEAAPEAQPETSGEAGDDGDFIWYRGVRVRRR